uniref:putative bifunctional diguanylate cyclase/phosphodiesterase n=1 Tax=Beijerinckia sp. L45 TaxID=1641855 RepID=UPI00131E5101
RLDVEFRIRDEGAEDKHRWLQALGRVVCDPATGRPVRIVGLNLDVTERKRIERRLERMARYDGLTGLANRTTFHEMLHEKVGEQTSGQKRFAILALDLNRFKSVNDTLGHPVGDKVLQEVAARMMGAVRHGDVVARLGGDEFAIIQEAGGVHQAEELARRLIAVIAAPISLNGRSIRVGASIGVAMAPDDGSTGDRLFRAADLALLRAKLRDEDAFQFFEPDMDDAARMRTELEQDLGRALERRELELAYQPILDARTRSVVSFEALVRWRHPVHGMVPPQSFIPLAEQTRLILPIGEWILRTACIAASRWPGIVIAVNVSAVQFTDPSFPKIVASALATSGLQAKRLELEITETALLQEEPAVANFDTLKTLGVKIALDDFGTGYSSLDYLRRMRFDRIKLDRSFVSEIGDPRSASIVRSVVGLATAIGMAITAKGVETGDQYASGRLTGCTEVQGFLFSRPLTEVQAGIVAQRPASLAGADPPSACSVR